MRRGNLPAMAGPLTARLNAVSTLVALATWLAFGSGVIKSYLVGETIRGVTVSPAWLASYGVFGVAVLGAMTLRLAPSQLWAALVLQVAAVAAMAILLPWAGMTMFLVIVAWQAALVLSPRKALAWVGAQTFIAVAALSQALNPDLCWVIGKSLALQVLLVFTAEMVRREAETARALGARNRELRAAQAVIETAVRNAERLRISRELHDAWGHELTALGLQLEIASHVSKDTQASDHVDIARGIARDLLRKVRDVVATLREAERGDLTSVLDRLARSVPVPAIHASVSADLAIAPAQAHVLARCAQEAVTNTMRHANAANIWLEVHGDGDGIRLTARDDGTPISKSGKKPEPGLGLRGMRERLEQMGGYLKVNGGTQQAGFTLDAWLPARLPVPS